MSLDCQGASLKGAFFLNLPGSKDDEDKSDFKAGCRKQQTEWRAQRLSDFLRREGFTDIGTPRKRSGFLCSLFRQTRVFAIHVAAEVGDAEMVRALLRAKADPSQKTSRGHTAVELARSADKLLGTDCETLCVFACFISDSAQDILCVTLRGFVCVDTVWNAFFRLIACSRSPRCRGMGPIARSWSC